mmetsp:Transcript_28293/g.65828  ORF Transcript_28293/g.65828 Transcript_28293/m.65828 type:complete len:293 (-) Transcript_28293:64-942(-)
MVAIPCDASISTLESTEPRVPKLMQNGDTSHVNGHPTCSRKETSIRFSDDLCTTNLIPSCSELADDDIESLWYSQRDFNRFKTLSRILAKNTRMRGPEVTGPVDEGYLKAKTIAFAMEEDALPRFLKRVDSHIEPLCTWARRKSTCRGLEYWTSKTHNVARAETRNDICCTVVELSEYNESPEVIADASMEYSRGSRILARFLGEADAQFRISRSRYEALKEEIMEDYFARISQTNEPMYPAPEEPSETVASYYDDSESDREEAADKEDEDSNSKPKARATHRQMAAALAGC